MQPAPSTTAPVQPQSRADRRRRRRVIVGIGVVGALMASLIAAATLLQPPRPISIVTVGSDYALNLTVQHNAYGWNSLRAACRLPADASSVRYGAGSLYRSERDPLRGGDGFNFTQATDRLTAPVNLLFVSLHGGADAQGAYLLREDASPRDAEDHRLRVTDLLEQLSLAPASQKTIVVFDATNDAGNTAYGEAENGFAAGLRDLNDAISAIPNLMVVSASDVGERSWEEPTLGRTVFLHTFLESLRGAACDPDQDGRLSADELFAHVAATVSARVSVTRQRTQSLLVLPLGEEGERRARGVEVALANTEYHPVPPATSAIDPETIAKRWEHVRRLEAELQRPETTATVAWRRYRRLVLRQEQLLLAGAKNAAQRIATELADLESTLRRNANARLLDPVQLGRPADATELALVADKAMADLTAAPAGRLNAVADKTFSAVDSETEPELRRLLYDRLLQRVESDPVGSLRPAAAISAAITPPDRAPPAEAYLLTLLADGLPSDLSEPAWPDAIRLAIRVRQSAEQTFASGETLDRAFTAELLPWLRDRHARADQRRQLGEDLLFGGVDYLPRATDALRTADALYGEIRADAALLLKALRVRDDAFDRLPFYVDAVSQVRAVHGDDPSEIAGLSDQLEAVWHAAHALGDALVVAEASASRANVSIDKIAAATDAVEQPLEDLRTAMRSWRSRLLSRTGASFCNNREAALAIPSMPVGERLQLLGVCPPDAEESATDQRALRLCKITQADWRAEETRRRVRLALTAVGRRLNDQAGDGLLAFDEAFARVAPPDAAAGPPPNPEPIDLKGAATVARQLFGVRRTVLESIASTAKQSLSSDITEVERVRLDDASGAARRFVWGKIPSTAESVLVNRERLKRWEFYSWRAERALDEGWGAASTERSPYFQLAATAYARRAERALPGQPATDRLLDRAAIPLELDLVTPQRVALVSTGANDVPLGVTSSAPAGHAVVSVEPSRDLVLETPAADSRLVASLAADDPDTTPAVVVRAASSATAEQRSPPRDNAIGSITYRGWFRGHRITKETPISVHRTPDILIDHPPRPAAAGVAIMAPRSLGESRHDGGVAFVLDASGSMGPVADGGAFKYAEAVESLRTLLAETPPGVRVSVWIFGHAVGPQKTANVAEAAIERLLDPTRWDPNDPSLLKRVTDRLAYPRIEPWNESALGRTLLSASRDLRGVSGYRAVIAITDGVDNRFAADAVANPQKQSLGEVLRQELSGSGIALHVVGFRVAGAEQLAARQQFAFLDQLTPPGRWWEASEPTALAETLRQVLGDHTTTPVVRRGESGGILRGVSDAFVTPTTAAPVWPSRPLEPGLYALPRLTESAEQRTLLAGGDLLLLSASRAPGNAAFRPASFTALRAPNKPAVETEGWRAALLNHRRLPDGSISMLAAIEQHVEGDGRPPSLLQVQRPRDLWVEADGIAASSDRIAWRRVEGYPAPCWEILRRGDGGEATDPRELTLWWTPPEGATVTRAIRRGEEFARIEELVGKSWDVEGQPITIRRLAVEQRPLPDPDGKVVRQSCLVVDLAGGPRCLVRLQGVATEGRRYERFDAAERSIAVFWPVSPEQLRDQLEGIDLTSFHDLRREAERRGLSATFTDLAPATPGDLRPTPSVGWFGPQPN